MPDECETFSDCNANGIPDECEADCDADGLPDDCEVDANSNGIPDDCESVDVVANGESTVWGTIGGSYIDTQAGDTVTESLQERESGGRPQLRRSRLQHTWTLNVAPSSSIMFHVRAYHSVNSEGDDFEFSWSDDNTTFNSMLTVTKTADDGMYQTAALPSSLSGTVYIRVEDTDRSQGFRSLDTLFVDHMFLRTTTSIGVPPVPPSGLAASSVSSSRIDVAWVDNSGDEDNFELERSLDGVNYALHATLGASVTNYSDLGLSASTTYHYRVRATNVNGDSDYSNTDSAVTAGAGTADDVANGETSVLGSVRSGSYISTQVSDGVSEILREERNGGPASQRVSSLEHKWTFNVTGGLSVEFMLRAFRAANSEGDDFTFAYSTDDVTYTDLITVTNSADIGYVGANLPASVSGGIWIRVVDTDRTTGNGSRETLTIDHMFVRSQ